jgi:hypothetical protein
MSSRLFLVFLRKPGRNDLRTDPFWEFGSFGCTGCHGHNLLNPKRRHVQDGDSLAFVQGGPEGCKLLLITAPIRRRDHLGGRVELRWSRKAKPFRYASPRAPVLADPGAGRVRLVELGRLVNSAKRASAQAKLASCFRACCRPLEIRLASELIRLFGEARRAAKASDVIRHYTDALPWVGYQMSKRERHTQYHRLLRELSGLPLRSQLSTARNKCRR